MGVGQIGYRGAQAGVPARGAVRATRLANVTASSRWAHLDIAVDGLAPMSAMDQRRDQFGEAVEYAVSLGARVAEH